MARAKAGLRAWHPKALFAKPDAKLGTFLGVFTPSVLTILGVILFLRTGWVVGQVGLAPALLIVLLAHAITFATALSTSAVATNMRVGTGGAYYMISRSLGLEIGGAIGIPLFLAQVFSVTLYAFGLAESIQLFRPDVPQQPVAAATVIVVALLAARGASFALRLQVPILALIGIALISFAAGAAGRSSDSLPLWQGAATEVSFWAVFAVFFPAVTGIMAGISLSGDLKDPRRSLPRGTLLAVLAGFVVYLTVPIVLALTSDPQTLSEDNLIWFSIATVPWLVVPALWGAIFSSAVGSILGAPRTFEMLQEDRVIPFLPKKIWGLSMPHFFSTALALAAVGLGDLNAVAPVLTMFFLTTYGMVNLVAGLEQLSGAPSYRPTIRVPWIVSLGGAAGCIWVMWLIQPAAAIVAAFVELLIYAGLRRRSLSTSWGDARHGALISLVRATLLKLREMPVDSKNWRPHILVFAGDVEKRLDLIHFASWLNQERGIVTVCNLLVGDLEELTSEASDRTRKANQRLRAADLVAFAETDIVDDFEEGAVQVLQANGIAGIASNTIMFGWSEKTDRLPSVLRITRKAAMLGKSTLLCRISSRRWVNSMRSIDVWWGGLERNGDMMLLFAYLLSANPEWSGARISVKVITTNEMTYERAENTLSGLIERNRINARTEIIELPEDQTVQEVIAHKSRQADLVFLGLRDSPLGSEEEYAKRLDSLVQDLPTVILVRAAGPYAGQLLERPDVNENGNGEPAEGLPD
ncbi:MAG TPA: Na-K-Cl cotransporter [Acidobacteriota bacterium]|nr:Na-K-Cl cotransporter [Acidobacteriota bacterium]